jgi:hypothetical protein
MALTDNLISCWELDETSDTRYDAHGDNDLTDTNAVGYAAGNLGNAADFVPVNNQYLSRADNAELSLGADTAFTIAAWFKSDVGTGSGKVICGKGAGYVTTTTEYLLWDSNASYTYQFAISNGSSTAVATIASFPESGGWHYIIGWHDPSDGADKIYVQFDNATPVEAAWSGGTVNDGSGAFGIGYATDGAVWDGLIDQTAFWKRVLTPQERSDLYNSSNGLAYSSWAPVGSLYLPSPVQRFTHILVR